MAQICDDIIFDQLGISLAVGRLTLDQVALVRIQDPQPRNGAHSSSGLGHRPLKAEIAGSNPACATTVNYPHAYVAGKLDGFQSKPSLPSSGNGSSRMLEPEHQR